MVGFGRAQVLLVVLSPVFLAFSGAWLLARCLFAALLFFFAWFSACHAPMPGERFNSAGFRLLLCCELGYNLAVDR
jgi:hypothetical protein